MIFRTKEALSEKQSPTRGSQLPGLKRANYQAMIWFNDLQARPVLLSLVVLTQIDYTGQQIVPVLWDLPCAPDFIIQLVRCSSIKNRCVPPCRCASVQLVCTEFMLWRRHMLWQSKTWYKYKKIRLKQKWHWRMMIVEQFDSLYWLSWTLKKVVVSS